ncbi:MAG: Ig-like domain repeat protein, partial [Nitrolancea sp.]
NAGNVETPHNSVTVKIDLTAPIISGDATVAANGNGWYKASVTIHWTCSDTLSGIATCPSNQVISGEGANQTVSGTATDNAGNSTTVDSTPVSIDLTAPTISGAPTTSPNGSGWYNTPVTIHWTCSDGLSGIDSCPSDSIISTEGTSQTASGTAVDKAGNSTTIDSPAVKIDLTAPTLVGTPTSDPNGNGWYNGSVTIHWTCSDAGSGVATCPSDAVITSEGNAQTVSGTATDNAGNSATVDSAPVDIDLTPPTVVYSGNQGTYTVDQTVTITCTASDALSGIDSTTCADITGPAYSFTIGSNSFSASATDKAGNTGDGSVSFTVVVTPNGLTNLTNQFESNGIARFQLDTELNGIRIAVNGNSAMLKSIYVNLYINSVNAQRGRTLTDEQADTLIALVKTL